MSDSEVRHVRQSCETLPFQKTRRSKIDSELPLVAELLKLLRREAAI